MDRCSLFYGFQFKNDFILNDQISTEAFVEEDIVLLNGDPNLTSHAQPAFLRFVFQHDLIDRFKQPRTESRLDLEASINNELRDFIFCHRCASLFIAHLPLLVSRQDPKPQRKNPYGSGRLTEGLESARIQR